MPGLFAAAQLGLLNEQIKRAGVEVNDDLVAVLNECQRATGGGFGRYVPDAGPSGAAGEAPVGEQADGVLLAHAGEGGSRVEHLSHARAALGALVADDRPGAVRDGVGDDRLERLFL